MTEPGGLISVLAVAGEGGSISLIQRPTPDGLFTLLTREIVHGLNDAESSEAPLQWHDWDQVLGALEAYPWRSLTPILISARHGDRLQAAFRMRPASWRKHNQWEQLFAQAPRILAVERSLHELMQLRAGNLIEEHEVVLPGLTAPANAMHEPEWFPIPGMYGGFSYRWAECSSEPLLVVESWCRVAEGSGQRHHITADSCTLIEEGFV